LQEVIKGKLKGETVVLEDDEGPATADVIDLAERLMASLRAASAGRKAAAPSRVAAKSRSRPASGKPKRKRAA
jgi:non-homologous end joining protein Ku